MIPGVGYTMSDIRYFWRDGLSSVGMSSEVELPQFRVLGHRQRATEINLTTGTNEQSISQYTHTLTHYIDTLLTHRHAHTYAAYRHTLIHTPEYNFRTFKHEKNHPTNRSTQSFTIHRDHKPQPNAHTELSHAFTKISTTPTFTHTLTHQSHTGCTSIQTATARASTTDVRLIGDFWCVLTAFYCVTPVVDFSLSWCACFLSFLLCICV